MYYYRINKLCIKLVIETRLHYDARSEKHQILCNCLKSVNGEYFRKHQSFTLIKASCVYCEVRIGSFKCYSDKLQVSKERRYENDDIYISYEYTNMPTEGQFFNPTAVFEIKSSQKMVGSQFPV